MRMIEMISGFAVSAKWLSYLDSSRYVLGLFLTSLIKSLLLCKKPRVPEKFSSKLHLARPCIVALSWEYLIFLRNATN
jgi:hypothetical protein